MRLTSKSSFVKPKCIHKHRWYQRSTDYIRFLKSFLVDGVKKQILVNVVQKIQDRTCSAWSLEEGEMHSAGKSRGQG